MARSKNSRKLVNGSAITPSRAPSPQPVIPPNHSQMGPRQVQMMAQFHQGPLPTPDVLQGYDDIVPGAAERVIAMAERQAIHRQTLEAAENDGEIAAQARTLEIEHARIQGLYATERFRVAVGSLLGIGFGAAAFWSMLHDKPVLVTLGFVALPIASIITAIVGKRDKDPTQQKG